MIAAPVRGGLLLQTDGPAWSVGLSVTTVSPAKTAEQIVMLFGKLTPVGPRNPCIRWGSRSPMQMANFEGKGAAHCKV